MASVISDAPSVSPLQGGRRVGFETKHARGHLRFNGRRFWSVQGVIELADGCFEGAIRFLIFCFSFSEVVLNYSCTVCLIFREKQHDENRTVGYSFVFEL